MATMLPQMDLHATGIGALPHLDPDAACRAVLAAFPRVPYAPTLPKQRAPRTDRLLRLGTPPGQGDRE